MSPLSLSDFFFVRGNTQGIELVSFQISLCCSSIIMVVHAAEVIYTCSRQKMEEALLPQTPLSVHGRMGQEYVLYTLLQ
jgi:hypothetical protein